MDEEESTFDSFIVASDSRKRKSLLPINKTTGTDASDLDILEESGWIILKIFENNSISINHKKDDATLKETVNKKRRSVLLSKLHDRTQNRSRHQRTGPRSIFQFLTF